MILLLCVCPFHRHCVKLRFTTPNNLELLDMLSGQFSFRLRIGRRGTLCSLVSSPLREHSTTNRFQEKSQSDVPPLGPQYGQVSVSALGAGRACPATVIAFCPSCHLVVRPLSVWRTGVHPSTLPPLATLAVRSPVPPPGGGGLLQGGGGLGGGGLRAWSTTAVRPLWSGTCRPQLQAQRIQQCDRLQA